MKKVYCSECKYDSFWCGCTDVHNVEWGDYYAKYYTNHYQEYKNKDNNCKWFEDKK